jgi:hypothetical protein
MPRRSVLAVPLIVMALLAAITGYVITRELRPPQQVAEVSVLELPATPTPTPKPTPEPTATTSRIRINTEDDSGDGRSCPAGCTCDFHPNGVVYRCGG